MAVWNNCVTIIHAILYQPWYIAFLVIYQGIAKEPIKGDAKLKCYKWNKNKMKRTEKQKGKFNMKKF